MPKMKEADLHAVLKSELETATGYIGGELSSQRREALDLYLGEPLGNEVEGRSQVIMTEVRDVIESMLPGLVEVFVSGEEVVSFEPVGMEDEDASKQATQYINHIFLKQNPGFRILYNWFKDTLLSKNGFVKAWWSDEEKVEHHTFEGLTEADFMLVVEPDDIEVVEHTEYQGPPDEMGFSEALHDVKIRRTVNDGRVVVEGLPPEEFRISRRAKTIEDAPYVAHVVERYRWELIQQGFDRKKVMSIPSDDDHEFNEERTARFTSDDEWPFYSNRPDEMMQKVWIHESYVRVDYDGDGVAELRRIIHDGKCSIILENEEEDECPIVDACAIPMPHKFFGLSFADFTSDLQKIKSMVVRQLLDNMYLVNNGRTIINDTVNLDDMLTNRPGQVVRSSSGNVGNAVMPLTTQSLGQYAYPLLEWLDSVRETRTGVTRYNQGLDGDSLNKTATGIQIIQTMAQKRQQLVARNMADAVGRLFKKILRLVIKHQDRPKTIRLRNEWVEFDPRPWNADMDVSVNVGLGHGTKEAQLQTLQMVMALQEKAVGLQGGPQGPLVTLDNLWNSARKATELAGFPHVEMFFTDPQGKPFQPPPNPEVEKAKGEMQLKQAELQQKQQNTQSQAQIKMREMQLEHERAVAEMNQKAAQFQQEIALKRAELELKAAELESGRMAEEAKTEAAVRKAEADIAVSTAKAENDMALAQAKADAQMEVMEAKESFDEEDQ